MKKPKMMEKPRNIWISKWAPTKIIPVDWAVIKEPLEEISYYWHYREANPIDWLKIQDKVFEYDSTLEVSTYFLIQELVEHQLNPTEDKK